MITRIELDGFKTFKDFALDLGPFQVIVGPNGAGKSNLFDAFRLLSRLASTDPSLIDSLEYAFIGIRGETEDLFTYIPGENSVDRMKIAVEMLVEPKVTDRLGVTVDLKYTRLRYELEVKRTNNKNVEKIQILHESLRAILAETDQWAKQYNVPLNKAKLSSENPSAPRNFISTHGENKETKIKLHKDGDSGERIYTADKVESTILTSVSNAEFPHVLAVQQKLKNCQFLQLNSEELRLSEYLRFRANRVKADNFVSLDLPRMLARLQEKDKFLLTDISRDVAELVPGITAIELKSIPELREPIIFVTTQDQRTFSWQGLSDGSLRLLALAILANDIDFNGIICMEEPENGIHPLKVKNIVRLLKGMATDFSDHEQAQEPLRQVLITTHSPVLISQPEVRDSLLFAYLATLVEPDKTSVRITRIEPVKTRNELQLDNSNEEKGSYYTLDQIEKYLTTKDFVDLSILDQLPAYQDLKIALRNSLAKISFTEKTHT